MYNLKRAPLLAAGLLLAASQPVVAETADATAAAATGTTVTVSLNRDQLHKLVSYGDLDLSSPQGMSTLNTRIRSAVCPREDTRDLQRLNGVRQCREMATEGAMLQVQQLASLQKAPLSAALKP